MSGVVTDVVSGAPVTGAAVAVQGKTATTGSDGRYSITGLTAGQVTLTAQHQGHVNFSQNVTISGATTTNIPMTPSNAAKLAGTWQDAASGTLISVSIDTVAQTVVVVIDYKGSKDPPPETFSGSYSTTTGANLTRTSPVFGTVALTVTPAGQITGSITNVPDADIRRIDFTGTATATRVTVTTTTKLTGGGADIVETLTLTR